METVAIPRASGSAPLERAIRVLEAVSAAGGQASASFLGARLGLPRASIHRLLGQLEHAGLLRRQGAAAQGAYVVGARLQSLGLEVVRGSTRQAPVRALLGELVADVRETCNLGILDGDAVLYLERVECDWPLQVRLAAGSRVALHATAIGKLLCAFLPRARRRALLGARPLPALTAHTRTDPDCLQRELAEVRRDGYAVNREENMDGIIGLAVPVHDRRGGVVAGLSVHAPSSRFDLDAARAALPRFRVAAAALGTLLDPAPGNAEPDDALAGAP